VKGDIIDPRIIPGSLITLNQRMRFVPVHIREMMTFRIENEVVPVWRQDSVGRALPYESVPSGSHATVLHRYVKDDVTKLEVLSSGKTYHCYGVHADLVE
jgi:hypothetical protein